jgi:hypothetical protein
MNVSPLGFLDQKEQTRVVIVFRAFCNVLYRCAFHRFRGHRGGVDDTGLIHWIPLSVHGFRFPGLLPLRLFPIPVFIEPISSDLFTFKFASHHTSIFTTTRTNFGA